MDTPEKSKSSIFRYFVYACPFFAGVLAALGLSIPFQGGGMEVTLGLLLASVFCAMLSFVLSIICLVLGQRRLGVRGLLLSFLVPVPLTLVILWGSAMLVRGQRERTIRRWNDFQQEIAYQMESTRGNSLKSIGHVELESIVPMDPVRELKTYADAMKCYPIHVKEFINKVLWSPNADLAFLRTQHGLWQIDLQAERQLIKAGIRLPESAQVELVGDDLLILDPETQQLFFVHASDLSLDVALSVPKCLWLAAHPEQDLVVISLTDRKRARLLSVSKREQIRFLLPSELPEEHWVDIGGGAKSLYQPNYQSVAFSDDGRHLILAGLETEYFSVLDNDVQYDQSASSTEGDKPQPWLRVIERSHSRNGYQASDFGTLHDKLHVKGESLHYREGAELTPVSQVYPISLSRFHDIAVVTYVEHGKDYYLMVYQDPQAPVE